MNRLFISTFLILLSVQAFGQKVFSPYPYIFDHLSTMGNLYNPAHTFFQKRNFAQIGYNDFNPLSNTIASYYVNGKLQLGMDSSNKPHQLGMFVINDKEGIYLIRLKAMGQYSYTLELMPEFYWTNGLSFGFVNNALKPNDVVASESIIVPDADYGMSWRYHNYQAGVAINQLFNAKLSFFNGSFQRKRYLTFTAGLDKELGPQTSVQIDFYGRTGPILFNKYVVSSLFHFQRHMRAGVTFKSGNGIIPMIGIHDVPVYNHRFGFLFSYAIPTSKIILSGSGNFELQLEYKFN